MQEKGLTSLTEPSVQDSVNGMLAEISKIKKTNCNISSKRNNIAKHAKRTHLDYYDTDKHNHETHPM